VVVDSLKVAEAGDILQVVVAEEIRGAVAPTGSLAVGEAVVGPRSELRPGAASVPRSANRFRIDSRTGFRAHSWSRSWDT